MSIYRVNNHDQVIRKSIDKSASRLQQQGWETIVSVKEEHVAILTKMQGEELKGIVVLVTDKAEAVFVNVIGRLKRQDIENIVAMAHQ